MTEAPLARVTRPIRGRLALAAALQAIAAVAGVLPVVAVAELARDLAGDAPATAGRVWPPVAAAAAAALVSLAAAYSAGVVAHHADTRMQTQLRRTLVAHLGRVPLGRVTEHGTGRISVAVHDDVHALHHLVAHTLLDAVSLVVVPGAALVYLLTVDARLTAVAVLPAVAGALLFRRAMSGAGAKMAQYHRAQQELAASAVAFADGIRVVKSFGSTGTAHGRFLRAADDFSVFFRAWSGQTLGVTTAAFLVVSSPLIVVLVVCCGGAMVIAGSLPPADLVAFAIAAPLPATPVAAVGTRLQQVQAGRAAAARIVAVLDEPTQPLPSAPRTPDGHEVRFEGVGFAYEPGHPVLDDVTLDLAPGTRTALVGRSGSGKSTLAALLPRFHDPDAGTVRIGGVDVRDINPEVLYRTVGFVLQDARLLRISVADNVRLARPDASLHDVQQAARAARIDDRIRELPRGYDAIVGEDVEFSGGETQRVSIARALLADTPLLVLDEATAFADPRAEADIHAALAELTAGRTVLAITHRLDNARDADHIVVLESGRIVEHGRHDTLVAADGPYATLWHTRGHAAAPIHPKEPA